MFFRVERTWLTDFSGNSVLIRDEAVYEREATSARMVVIDFAAAEGGRVLGSITEHAGGAAAIVWHDGRLYSLLVDPVPD